MRSFILALFVAAVFLTLLMSESVAPPAIDQGSVVNAASRIPSTLPAGSLARGSRIVIRGLRMGPQARVRIAQQQGQAIEAPVVQADDERLEALIPAAAVTSAATLTVIRGNQQSRPYPINIVESSLGLFSANGRGWGPAGRPNTSSAGNPAFAPGATVTLWATGLGNAREVRITAGGISAPARAVERGTDGVDRIEFRLPPEVPSGCYVPVQAEAAGIPTNVVTVAVARAGESCAVADPWFTKQSHPGGRTGWIVLMRSKVRLELMAGKRVDFTVDSAIGSFHQEPAQAEQHLTPFELIPPVGSCTTYSARLDLDAMVLPALVRQNVAGRDLNLGPRVEAEAHSRNSLDAGASFTVTGRNGVQKVERAVRPPHVYTAVLGGNPPFTRIEPKPLFLAPGRFQIALPGGADLPSTSATVDVSRSIEWMNEKQAALIARSRGITLTWRATNEHAYVPIAAVNVDRTNSVAGVCVCLAEAGSGHFTIPAQSLRNIPATPAAGSDLEMGFMAIGEAPGSAPERLDWKSIDSGFALFVSMAGRTVRFE